MGWGRLTVAAVAGYLSGTVPSADLAARAATGGRVDLRSTGSGNPGGLNTAATIGARWGAVVTVADVGKGVVAATAGRAVAGDVGAHVAATAAVVGHCHPLWSGFRGGKGVATSVGQVLATFPAYLPIDAAVGAATVALPTWERRTFAATTVAAGTWVTASVIWWRRELPNLWGPPPTAALPLAAAISSAVIIGRFLRQESDHGRAGEDRGTPPGS